MATPNNETYDNMNQTNPNMNLNNYQPGPIYTPVQPVQMVGGPQMVMPINQNVPPVMVPVQPQPQTIIVQQPPEQKVIVVQEGRRKKSSGRACYCHGPKQSPCGCCDPNEEYCCIIIVFAYILMSLRYILMCLCILSICRNFRHHGIC